MSDLLNALLIVAGCLAVLSGFFLAIVAGFALLIWNAVKGADDE